MPPTLPDRAPACQAKSDGPAGSAQDNAVVLQLLRDAIAESGWKHEAVASAMGAASGLSIDGPYLSKLLSGEKPWSLRHLLALPDDIEARFAEKWAALRGAVVVAPLAGDAAVAALVGGLVGVLTGAALPARATQMARVSLSRAAVPAPAVPVAAGGKRL